ncbi:hypothetical protein XBP1_2990049 [Xenorhabdus bovienii str. puntauvense]|uniref:Uncharacterized protein n=4 Tax=Xenorhabdus bovienii TaxID=40576 RepID=A0A0B6XF28_XENBV|nr:hypothetical protein XBFFR1_1840085 [Xenorhabdus bovienii str. feltiae France]CDG94101.1 hypothetical protein XBFFL1_310085 [Xenorhabdus bovienii str. feltiae Florida]CDG98265.1 hypothetical protein XBP1_2990049 [Xenorhabdus bovienii str. puntauvense]CDG99918.1 hypothetical protein XBFM1_1260067 [Xenorhabdus bovienii str. feltiae Moldova]CDH23736.1 hypothetical protein XBKB1_20061 [Xenorhabdus bovienii str. kraussei Becker Underwood]CDM91756.1 protein of unknown function [Xenorhabdus bovien
MLLEMVHGGFQARTKKVVIHQSERLLSDVEAKNVLNIS